MASESSQSEKHWLETLLQKFNYDNSLSKLLSLTEEELVPKGDYYCSKITRVKLDILLNSGEKCKKSIIVKKGVNTALPLPLFKTEIKVYGELLTKYEPLMNEFQDLNDRLWGEMIGYEPYSIIVLEDLTAKNFHVPDRRNLMDLNHALLVLNSLGRFHGMSYVLLQKGLINKNDFGNHFLGIDNPLSDRLEGGAFKQLAAVMKEYWPSEWKDIAKKFAEESKVVSCKIQKCLEYPEDTFLVLNHGDCWTCNFMFKYCPYDKNLPIAMKFVDFQMYTCNSYIIDLIHFIYMCVHPEIRRLNINKLYMEYQKSLETTLSFYGFPGIAPTLKHIYTEAKRVEYFGMVFSTAFLPLMIFDQLIGLSMEKLHGCDDSKDAFNPEIYKSEKFRKIMEDDIKKWFDEGLFDRTI